jgi:NAD(P)-dependent dehydrogenase (short-subunit alcohol dehydrogenase family)
LLTCFPRTATSSIAPPFIIYSLNRAHLLPSGSKILLISSESGSITLRHAKEGGGNYAHHASKAALNMVGKLLSLDLKEHGVIVSIVHPGFMRTEMTKGVGFDKYWDDGGAVSPEEAAGTLVQWVEGLGMEKSGEYWAPRGPSECFVLWLFVCRDVLTVNRRYWDGGGDNGEEFTYTITSAVVGDGLEGGRYQLMLEEATKTMITTLQLFITFSAPTLKSDLKVK